MIPAFHSHSRPSFWSPWGAVLHPFPDNLNSQTPSSLAAWAAHSSRLGDDSLVKGYVSPTVQMWKLRTGRTQPDPVIACGENTSQDLVCASPQLAKAPPGMSAPRPRVCAFPPLPLPEVPLWSGVTVSPSRSQGYICPEPGASSWVRPSRPHRTHQASVSVWCRVGVGRNWGRNSVLEAAPPPRGPG